MIVLHIRAFIQWFTDPDDETARVSPSTHSSSPHRHRRDRRSDLSRQPDQRQAQRHRRAIQLGDALTGAPTLSRHRTRPVGQRRRVVPCPAPAGRRHRRFTCVARGEARGDPAAAPARSCSEPCRRTLRRTARICPFPANGPRPIGWCPARIAMLEWCHLSHGSGRSQLKRSNRLVLLIGIFLALVAFVLILVDARTATAAATGGPRRQPQRPPRSSSPRGTSSSGRRSRTDVEQSELDDHGLPAGRHRARRAWSSARSRARTSPRASSSRPRSSRAPRAASGTWRFRRATSPWPSRSTRSPASARSSRPATTSTWSPGSPAPTRCRSWSRRPAPGGATPRPNATAPPRAGFIPEVLPYNSTTVKTLVQGIQVLGTLLPPPSDTRTQTAGAGLRGQRPRPSTASSRS